MINSLFPVCFIAKCICILCVMLLCEKHYALDEVKLSHRYPPCQTSRLKVRDTMRVSGESLFIPQDDGE